jgi:hypothetical protein
MNQQEIFYVVAGIEEDEIFGYLAANADEVYVNDIESQGILVFRTPEVAEDAARKHSECGECKVIPVHREYLDVSAVPDEPLEVRCPECPECDCAHCRIEGGE